MRIPSTCRWRRDSLSVPRTAVATGARETLARLAACKLRNRFAGLTGCVTRSGMQVSMCPCNEGRPLSALRPLLHCHQVTFCHQ